MSKKKVLVVDDSATTNAGQAVTIAVITNDSDPDDDEFSVTANTSGDGEHVP